MQDLHLLSIVKTISGIGFLICLLFKVGLHIYLDLANNRTSGIAVYLYTPLTFFKRYNKGNSMQYHVACFACNACLYAFYFLFAINLAVGILILLVR